MIGLGVPRYDRFSVDPVSQSPARSKAPVEDFCHGLQHLLDSLTTYNRIHLLHTSVSLAARPPLQRYLLV